MGRPPSNSHVALEQQAETSDRLLRPTEKLLYLADQYVPASIKAGATHGSLGAREWCHAMGNMLREADTYYVAEHMMEVIEGSAGSMPSFPMTMYHVPCESGFCYLPVAHQVSAAFKALGLGGVPARAFAWTLAPHEQEGPSPPYGCGTDIPGAGWCRMCGHLHLTRLYWLAFAENDWPGEPRYLVPTGLAYMPLGKDKNWNDSFTVVDGDNGRPLGDPDHSLSVISLRFFVSFLCFIKQKCVMEIQDRAPRSTRRRLPEDWKPEPTVRTILLRKYAEEVECQGHSDVDWQCKWWVGGHWRDQWYPSLKVHSPVFIAPYIKGPEDKPLKAPGKVLYDVAR